MKRIPNWVISDDKQTLRVGFADEDLTLDAAAADGLIETLGLMRAQMQPAHPEKMEAGEITIAADPGWQVDGTEGRTLHIRDGRFGWLHYRLSPETADRMSRALKKD